MSIKTYAEELREVAAGIMSEANITAGETKLRLKRLAAQHGVGIRAVEEDISKIVEAKKKELETAAGAIGADNMCEEGREIGLRWPGHLPARVISDPSQIPRSFDDFKWPIGIEDVPYALEILSREFALVTLEGKSRYVDHGGIEQGKGIAFYTRADFEEKFANKRAVFFTKEGAPKERTLVELYRTAPGRTEYSSVTFCPQCQGRGKGELNLFVGFGVRDERGDWGLLRKHILDNICQGNDLHFRWLMSWMAQIVQEPAQKLGTAVVLKGKKGTGKSKLAQWLRHVIGKHHSLLVSASSLN